MSGASFMQHIKTILVGNATAWGLIVFSMRWARFSKVANRIFQSLLYARCRLEAAKLNDIARRASPSLIVKNGPFKGIVYPSLASAGSMLCPKLLGTYELELAAIFRADYLRQFNLIVDVGCAEGYYAVGCAVAAPASRVIAYDTSEQARRLCEQMAEANQVSERIQIKSECTSSDFANLDGCRALVIVDCEGYEAELFQEETVTNLRACDLIIEIHPQFGVDAKAIEKLFIGTHATELIYSMTDYEKGRAYTGPDLERESLGTKIEALAECRPTRMTWIYARSKRAA
jgi:hypothetical protein